MVAERSVVEAILRGFGDALTFGLSVAENRSDFDEAPGPVQELTEAARHNQTENP